MSYNTVKLSLQLQDSLPLLVDGRDRKLPFFEWNNLAFIYLQLNLFCYLEASFPQRKVNSHASGILIDNGYFPFFVRSPVLKLFSTLYPKDKFKVSKFVLILRY